MKLSKEKPKIYPRLVEVFGIDWNKGIIITYGDTVYCSVELENHLIAHEEVHVRQQTEYGVEAWWERYLIDPEFRLDQELEAYRAQAKYLREHTEEMSRGQRQIWFITMARLLSGSIYGNLVSFNKAMELIKQ